MNRYDTIAIAPKGEIKNNCDSIQWAQCTLIKDTIDKQIQYYMGGIQGDDDIQIRTSIGVNEHKVGSYI